MFEQTISFCRRILGVDKVAAYPNGNREDRRQTARYPSEQVVNYSSTLANGNAKTQNQAMVRNVSTGGISLLVTEQHKPGELLSIQLPQQNGHSPVTVLACVVHCQPVENNTYAIGCTFARELTHEDLAYFGAQMGRHPEEDDLRNQPRSMCNMEASYRVIDDESDDVQAANVINISTTGVGLLISDCLPVGTLINVELHHIEDRESKNLLCCVVHAAGDSSEWTIGCNFITELKEFEFNRLLHQ